jgi:hypothetical protein
MNRVDLHLVLLVIVLVLVALMFFGVGVVPGGKAF